MDCRPAVAHKTTQAGELRSGNGRRTHRRSGRDSRRADLADGRTSRAPAEALARRHAHLHSRRSRDPVLLAPLGRLRLVHARPGRGPRRANAGEEVRRLGYGHGPAAQFSAVGHQRHSGTDHQLSFRPSPRTLGQTDSLHPRRHARRGAGHGGTGIQPAHRRPRSRHPGQPVARRSEPHPHRFRSLLDVFRVCRDHRRLSLRRVDQRRGSQARCSAVSTGSSGC